MVNTENLTLTQEEISVAEKFHTILERNMNSYWKWWEWDEDGSCVGSRMSRDASWQIGEFAKTVPLNCVYTVGYYGMTILHQLATHNYYEAMKTLLQRGAKADVRGGEGKGDYVDSYKGVTPLHIACHSGNAAMVKLLLEYGADSTLSDDKGRNCYHFLAGERLGIRAHDDPKDIAIGLQRLEIAKLLKADVNQKDQDGMTPLLRLVEKDTGRKSMFLIQHFLDNGADMTATDAQGNTALMLAAEYTHVTASKILMDSASQEQLDCQNAQGDTALHKALTAYTKKNMATAYMLVQKGANCNIKNQNQESVTDYVNAKEESYYGSHFKKMILGRRLSLEDYFEMMKRFSDDWWGGQYDDYNAFMFTIARDILRKVDRDDDTELVYVKELLEVLLGENCGAAAVSILQEENYDLCMPICERGQVTTIRDICVDYAWRDTEVIPKLTRLGVDMNEARVNGCTPAFLIVNSISGNAGEHVYRAAVKCLQGLSAESMTQLNYAGISALHIAAYKLKNPMVLEYMIRCGADVNVTADAPGENAKRSAWMRVTPGDTPLHTACTYHNVEAVKLLKAAGADDSIMNSEEEIPAHCLFHDESQYDSKTSCEILRLLDCVDTAKAESGETPLLYMLRRGKYNALDMLEIFLDKGVDINKADNKGNTPLLRNADYHCERDIIKLLLSEGADINARNVDGNSALLFALKDGDCELARLLIKKGADYNIMNEKGETPASIAIEKGYDIVLELMTDITVFPSSEDDEIDYDDYDDDYDEDDDDDDDDYDCDEITVEQYRAIEQGYVQMYGEEKGRRMAELSVRMAEMNQNGSAQSHMDEYMALVNEFQEIMGR